MDPQLLPARMRDDAPPWTQTVLAFLAEKGKMGKAVKTAKADAAQAGDDAKTRFAQMKADAAAKLAETKRTIDRQGDQFDARVADDNALMAEDDAAAAIDYAEWAVDNARIAILDAIDARVYAGQKAASIRT